VTAPPVRTLLIGAGQVGQAVAAALAEPPSTVQVPWEEPASARKVIGDAVQRFLHDAEGRRWALCWSAGKGVVGTPAAALELERSYLDAALAAVAATPADVRSHGQLCLASSAGGIHARDRSGAVTEASEPTPVSQYGHHKLRQEQDVRRFAAASGLPCLLGRISNVYGPGQDLRKSQGFISVLCRAMLRRDGFVLTVPPDTIRDFVYGADVGRRMAAWLEAEHRDLAGAAAVKLLVSGRSTTLHEVIAVVRSVARVPARITVSALPRPGHQPLRTVFHSMSLPELDRAAPTTCLAEGVHRTWQHLLHATTVGGTGG